MVATALLLAFASSSRSQSQSLINIDLDAGTATSKVGPAAIGQSASDFWNFYTRDDGAGGWLTLGAFPNLKYADGTTSSAGLVVINAPGAWNNGSSDPMFAGYIYPFSGNATLNVTNLPAGSYDFYLYALDGNLQVTVGGADYGTRTTSGPLVNPMVWHEGVHYVVMRSAEIAAGQTATVTVRPGASGYAVISGLQIVSSSGPASTEPPTITSQPAGKSVTIGSAVSFNVLASGAVPFTYRWYFNESELNGATDYVLTLNNVQTNNSGDYRVIVSNAYGSATSSVATLTVSQLAPAITTQPQSQTVAAGSNATFAVTATGAPTLRYQWLFNGTNLNRASGSSLTINNAQPVNAGAYSVRVYNNYGAVTSSVATLTVTGIPPAIVTEPASITVPSGTNVTFTVSASGSPPLKYQWRFNGNPITGATKSSLTLNDVQTNQSGNYSVVVSNAFGDATSADATLTVIHLNRAPVANDQSVTLTYNGSASITLAASDPDGDSLTYAVVNPIHGTLGGTAPNLIYNAASNYSGSDSFTFTANDGQADSAPATVNITVLPEGTLSLINVDFGAGPVTSKTGLAATGHTINDFWNFYTRDDGHGGWLSAGALSSLKTAENTSTAVGLAVMNAPGAWGNGSDDPMYASYIYPFNGGNVTVTITNLPAGQYDLYVYGGDSGYQAAVGNTSYGAKSLPGNAPVNPVVWQEGVHYVVFRNVSVGSDGAPLTLTVTPGAGGYATISGIQIAGANPINHAPVANAQNVIVAQDGTKAITLTGSDPDGDALTYLVTSLPAHGTLTGAAPNVTYEPAAGYAGADSFSFKVNDGQADSAEATISITVLSANTRPLIDVDFGAGATTKTGLAATGHAPSDYWNFYDRNDANGGWKSFGALGELKTVEGAATQAGLTVANAPGAWGNGSDDPMYASYIYPFDGGNVTVTITNLDAGAYAFYVYGIESSYEIKVNGLSYGIKSLPGGPVVNPVAWQENLQYALFPAVQVGGGETVVLTVRPGASGYSTVSGMQIAQVTAPPPIAPSITEQPASQTVSEGSDVTFSVTASGTSPLSYQWRRNGVNINGATERTLTLRHVGFGDAGNYSVRVSNPVSSVDSVDVVLTVSAVNHPPVANSQTVVLAQNGSAAVTLSGGDADSNALAFIVTTLPTHGTLSGTAPNLTYQAMANYSGADSFTFKVNDGQADSAIATVSITVLSDVSKALINVDFGAGSSSKVGPAAAGQSAADFWNFYDRNDGFGNWQTFGVLSNLKFADGAASGAGLTVENAPGAWGNGSDDPMYASYIYPFNGGNVTVTVTNLASGQYDLYVYGTESSHQLTVGGANYGTKSLPRVSAVNPVVWQESVQYVVFRNVAISAGQAMVLTVRPGSDGYATISGLQLASVNPTNHVPVASAESVTVTQDNSKAIILSGADLDGDALTYVVTTLPAHGILSGAAPNVTYEPLAGYAGSDSFAFKVNDGQIDSAEATVTITVLAPGAQQFINIDFGAGSGSKVGLAAAGQTAADFWNFYDRNDGNGGWLTFGWVSPLKFADGSASTAGITVANAPGSWGNGSDDPMYASYIYPFDGNATLNITNLPAGAYDFYVYGLDANYQINVEAADYGNKSTATAAAVNPIVWHENEQYVVFRGVQVSNSAQAVTLTVRPGQSGYAVISGLQIASSGTVTPPSTNIAPIAEAALAEAMPSLPGGGNLFIVSANGSNATVVLDASFSSDVNNDLLSYRWLEDSLAPLATGVAAARVFEVGRHSVTLLVSDGKATATVTLQFEVLTVPDAMLELLSAVENSELNRTIKRPLLETLLNESANSDIARLEAFQNKVQSYVVPANPTLAESLMNAAQHIIYSATPH
jgi:hypothetical protein